ncbi:MAG: glycosyltransferase [Kiritimatiellae bacterium]|nr:glycosyltransferase [Kiritimatiellia bacterium]
MKVLVYAGIVSPHMIPLCDSLYARLGPGNFLYCATLRMRQERSKLGWKEAEREWIVRYDGVPPCDVLEVYADKFDVLFVSEFEPKVIECFRKRGKRILYASERWLKPPFGAIRFIKKSFVRRAMEFASLLRSYNKFLYLPIGPHAAVDALRIACYTKLDVIGGLRNRRIAFEKHPMGRLSALGRSEVLLDKMRMWGYYVAPSKKDALPVQEASKSKPHAIKVLWVGRLLNLKRVDTIVRAVGEHVNLKRVDNSLPEITLDIYGSGPAEKILKKMAAQYGDAVKFYPPVPIEEVRRLMREHGVYVLASNGYEGWGAVVSEALEEGMTVLGTYEAGSSATILPEGCLFHAGDWRALKKLLSGISCKTMENHVNGNCASLWTAEAGAKALCEYLEDGGFNE